MAIHDLFSKRQKKHRGDVSDVYTYDDIPEALRVQITYIWKDVLGDDLYIENYQPIIDDLCREYGIFEQPTTSMAKHYDMPFTELVDYLLQEKDVEKQLDIVELSFKTVTDSYSSGDHVSKAAIEELNHRFKEHGIGFQFIENEIIRIDSELIHEEAVKPALRLLNGENYQGAQQEFLSAYDHYRHGKNKDSLNECLKAFESTMKAICEKNNWDYQANATVKSLIQICFDNNLVPSFWQQQLDSLRSLLESGIPTGRNKLSAHGQGTTPTVVPGYLVAYMLHMTASTLVFLITAEREMHNK